MCVDFEIPTQAKIIQKKKLKWVGVSATTHTPNFQSAATEASQARAQGPGPSALAHNGPKINK